MQLNEKTVRHALNYKTGVKQILMQAGMSEGLALMVAEEVQAVEGWAAQITRWSQAMGRPVPGLPRPFARNELEFRNKLFQEERAEYGAALGSARAIWDSVPLSELEEINAYRVAMTEVADGIADQIFLLLGDAAELGMGNVMDRVMQRVIDANMAKLAADGKPIVNGVTLGYRAEGGHGYEGPESGYRPDQPIGKILKPKGWQSPDPDIQKMLFPEG